jgi:benzoate/toluate 1,2-dioxygenase reductase subunit
MKSPPNQKTATKPFRAELLSRRWLSDATFEIELARPSLFEFNPGQSIRVIHQQLERDYSLVSDPTGPTLSLCIRNVQDGSLTPLLATAKIRSRISFTGPHGYFTFRPAQRPPVFIATGTGVAPFVSMVRSGVKGFTLLHGVREPSELYYKSLFRTATKNYVTCFSGSAPESPEPEDVFQGRVTDYLERNLPPGIYDFYLSGRIEMVRDVTHLVDERFPGSLVYTEIFY